MYRNILRSLCCSHIRDCHLVDENVYRLRKVDKLRLGFQSKHMYDCSFFIFSEIENDSRSMINFEDEYVSLSVTLSEGPFAPQIAFFLSPSFKTHLFTRPATPDARDVRLSLSFRFARVHAGDCASCCY